MPPSFLQARMRSATPGVHLKLRMALHQCKVPELAQCVSLRLIATAAGVKTREPSARVSRGVHRRVKRGGRPDPKQACKRRQARKGGREVKVLFRLRGGGGMLQTSKTTHVGRCFTNFPAIRPHIGRVRSKFGDGRADSATTHPTSVDSGPDLADLGRNRPNLGRTRPKLAEFSPNLGPHKFVSSASPDADGNDVRLCEAYAGDALGDHPMTGPKSNQLEFRPKMGAQSFDLDAGPLFRRRFWPWSRSARSSAEEFDSIAPAPGTRNVVHLERPCSSEFAADRTSGRPWTVPRIHILQRSP